MHYDPVTNEVDREYTLSRSTCDHWDMPNRLSYYIVLRPEHWMFTGKWEYVMHYTNANGEHRLQVLGNKPLRLCNAFGVCNNFDAITSIPEDITPSPVSNVQIVEDQNAGVIRVSWSAIGTDPNLVDYRVRVFDPNGVCPEMQYRMNWTNTFIPLGYCINTNPYMVPYLTCNGNLVGYRVNFEIPIVFSGRLVRFEQYFIPAWPLQLTSWPRALVSIFLP